MHWQDMGNPLTLIYGGAGAEDYPAPPKSIKFKSKYHGYRNDQDNRFYNSNIF
jgi:hypothetical protein